MSRDDYVQQGKQFANDLRDTASKKVAENEDSILGAIGKAARWVDEKTGGKYSDQIGKAEAKAGESVGWAAKQGTGEPQAPGAAAGDGISDTGPTGPTASAPPGGPTASGAPSAPGAAATPEPPTGPVGPPAGAPSDAPTTPGTPAAPGRPTHPPRDDSADWPRPPQ